MMFKIGSKSFKYAFNFAFKKAPLDATVCLLQVVTRPVINKEDKKEVSIVDTSYHYFTDANVAKRYASEEFMDTEKGYSVMFEAPTLFVKPIKGYEVKLGSFFITNYIIPLK